MNAIKELELAEPTSFGTIHLQLSPALTITPDEFFDICQQNELLRIERSAKGELIVTPAGFEGSSQNSLLGSQLVVWNATSGLGVAHDSSGGFQLPNGAIRSPDASWVSFERLATVTREQLLKHPPLSPDFVLVLLSPSDRLRAAREKMDEYIANGVRLGFLLDPRTKRVYIYRPEREVEVLEDPATVPGDPDLPGFVLNLGAVWDPYRGHIK